VLTTSLSTTTNKQYQACLVTLTKSIPWRRLWKNA